MDNVTIRKATVEDAAEIANVHTRSWQEAYIGLLPQSFLDDIPLTFKKRHELWKRLASDETQITLVAQSQEHGIVGFINGSLGREETLSAHAEVWCIYLLKKYHGKEIGFNLLKNFFDLQLSLGRQKAYLWVLDHNPTISFYEKTGGTFNGLVKEEMIAGQKVKELCYRWEDLKLERK